MVDTIIDDLFAKLTTIANDKIQCEPLFAELKMYIDDYQLIDETMYYLYSARYFRARANFFHSLEKHDDAAKQEQLAIRFQLKYEQQKPVASLVNPVSVELTSSKDEIEEKQAVLKAFDLLLKDLSDGIGILEKDDIVAKLRETTNRLVSFQSCQSLDDYLCLQNLATGIQRSSRLLHDPLSDPVGENLAHIDTFNVLIREYLYKQRVTFARFLLANPEALFVNVPQLQRNLDVHTRRLAALFHTDKALGNEDQSLFQKLFVLIYSQKETLLSKINVSTRKSEIIEQFKKQGLEWWQRAVDISRARKDLWTEIKYLDPGSLRNLTDNELALLQSDYACQAYQYYRLACHTLGNEGDLNEQIELRKFMALALHLAEKTKFRLEAQLYAIAAIHLLVEYMPDFPLSKFTELQRLFVKIQGGSTTTTTTTDQSAALPVSSVALVPVNPTGRNAAHIKRNIRAAVIDDKRQLLLRQCLVRGNNLRINTAEEYILEAKSQATRSIVSGVTVALSGSAVTAGIGVKIYADVMTGFAAGSVVGPIGSIIGASVGLISGGYMGYLLCKKGGELIEEPLIREELNVILGEASKCHLANDIDGFFKMLARHYACYTKRLLKIFLVEDHVEIKIDAEAIVHELLAHEFRPDGVAYLLILIGEGLLRGPTLKAEGHENKLDPQTANVEAQKLFREAYSNASLQEKAHFLDSKVAQSKLEDRSRFVNKLFQKFNRSVYSIPKEYFDDAMTTPFTTRLSELSQIARLNYAMTHLFEADQENLKRSHHAIQRLKLDMEKTKSQQFFQLPELRIKAIEDLLGAFGFFEETTNNLAIETRCLLSIENPTPIELIDKVLIGNTSVARCERCMTVTESKQGFTILAELLATSKSYSNQQHRSKDLPNEILTVKNLPTIADNYRIDFQLCEIQSHPEHGRVFVPKGEKIICRHCTKTICIYVVLDDEQKTTIIGMFVIAEPQINYILQKLSGAKSDTDRFNLNTEVAEIYQERAERAELQHHLLALPLWLDALQYYTAARQLSDSPTAIIGLLRCMIKLGRYARAENTLRDFLLTSMKTSGEAWYLRAVACRKQAKFDDAHHAAREALRFDYMNAQKELKLCEKLKDETINTRIKVYERMVVSNSAINRTDASCNILSIDGGGVRGIIPAVWLCELERHTKRSCSSLFNMMAGTSTGAIITTALATPVSRNSKEPRYKAFDILQLYRTQTPTVFMPSSGILDRLGASLSKSARYLDTGRSEIFRQYYGDTRLSDLLVATVIPAVTGQSHGTRLFTNLRNTYTHMSDYQIHDVLMCTSAAPTYFEPYKLDSVLYVDGGVQANNPTMEAFGQALDCKISQDKIFVLSLGTGDYVPDPLHSNSSRNLLFWAANSDTVTKVIFDGPQNNIDLNMSRLLGETNYHRWQVWFEKPIALDDTNEKTLDFLCDLAREHFEAMDALDNRKRLGLLIEHLRSDN